MGKISAAFFFVLFLACGKGVFAQQSGAEGFSAKMESKTKDGAVVSGTMYADKDKGRWEMPGMITISRIDKKIGWVVFPDQQMYMEVPIKDQENLFPVDKFPGETGRRLIGEETIECRSTDKYEVTCSLESGVEKRFVWITKESPRFPIRSEAADGSWYVLYKDFNVAPQAAGLFEIPEGYQKFDYGQSEKERVTVEKGDVLPDETQAPGDPTGE